MFSRVYCSIKNNLFNAGPYDEILNAKRIWYLWFTLAICLFMLQASTIGILPSLMQDEAQITDYGRLALNPLSEWSVTWWVAGDKPLLLWSYIGPLIAEWGYQIGGISGIGPRILALLGGLAAGSCALGWLLERKVPRKIAGLLAMALLLDPLFTLSQRMARSDSWVVACCLASCWLLRLASNKHGSGKIISIIISGMLAALAAFIWPSAIFLYPLICLEFFHLIFGIKDVKWSWSKLMVYAFYFILSGLLISFVLILPIRHQLVTILGDMEDMVALNVNSNKSPLDRLLGLFSYHPWLKLIKAFAKTLSPFLPLLAAWAVVFRRDKGMVLAATFTLAIIFSTLVYEFRILYMLPYFVALSGDHFKRLFNVKSNIHRLSTSFLILVVVWSFSITILLRSAIAYGDKPLHNRSLITNAATSAIGSGNYKVFLAFTYELYFSGRSLGWQLYTPYIQFRYDAEGNWIRKGDYQPEDKFLELMSTMDYAIFQKGNVNAEMERKLQLSGLRYSSTIYVGDELHNKSAESMADRINETLLWFLRGAKSYGPYILYARPKSNVNLIEVNSRNN
jgi:4-amino-4-deoxy-L-arabinose transferase-like glycosyltransferase